MKTYIKTHISVIAFVVFSLSFGVVEAQSMSDVPYRTNDSNMYAMQDMYAYASREYDTNQNPVMYTGQDPRYTYEYNTSNNFSNSTVNTGNLSANSNTYQNTYSRIPSGNFASVDSVYLNQVPYTGPEDIAKGIAFVIAILVWSIMGASIIRTKINKKVVANRIEAFKNANRISIA